MDVIQTNPHFRRKRSIAKSIFVIFCLLLHCVLVSSKKETRVLREPTRFIGFLPLLLLWPPKEIGSKMALGTIVEEHFHHPPLPTSPLSCKKTTHPEAPPVILLPQIGTNEMTLGERVSKVSIYDFCTFFLTDLLYYNFSL